MPAIACPTEPSELVFKILESRPVIEKLVVVAWAVVAFVAVKFWKVDELLTSKLVIELKTEVSEPIKPVLARTIVVDAIPETKREVEVALVVVALVAMKVERVEDAVETKPLLNSRVVVVAFSPVPSLVKG